MAQLIDLVLFRSAVRTRRARNDTPIERYKYGYTRMKGESVLEKLETSVHVRLSSRTYNALEKARKRLGVSIGWIVRHATQDYLSRKGYFRDEA